MSKIILNRISELNYELQKLKLVQNNFPDAKYFYNFDHKARAKVLEFCSKSINANYTDIEFVKDSHNLYAKPHTNLLFTYNGKEEIIKIYSDPKQNRLAFIKTVKGKSTMKFSRFVFNLKKHNFREDLFNSCRTNILNFIKEHPGIKLDSKHLEDRLKKLLVFS